MSLQDAVNKVSYVNDSITKTVSEVKQRCRSKENTTTNGHEGQLCLRKRRFHLNFLILQQGMRRLHDSITIINKDFLDDVDFCT